MMMRVLVTGGAGFIGSHVVEALLARGDDVHVIDDLSKGDVKNVPDGVPVDVVDISSADAGRAIGAWRYDAVVHCAAQTSVLRSLAEPDLDHRINVVGLERVLEAAAASETRRFVFISSGGAAYGETPAPASEATPVRPDNPYGRHKVKGEGIVARGRIPSVSLRLSNVYGARQRSDAEGGVVSILAERMARGLPIHVYGDGEQTRDFVHVSDVVAAITLALDDAAMTGVWNVGSGVATSINELARVMQNVVGGEVRIERLPARAEIRQSMLDVAKLLGTKRWRPATTLRDGIEMMATSLGHLSDPRINAR